MPQWADGKCIFVFSLTFLALIGACASCYLILTNMSGDAIHPTGLKIWVFSVVALLGNSLFLFKGLYDKFFDRGLDAYY